MMLRAWIVAIALGGAGALPGAADRDLLFDGALILYNDGEAQAVIDLLKQAAEISPPSAQHNLLRGHALRRLHRDGDAAAAFEKALKLEPENFEAGINLGLACFAAGQWARAREAFQQTSLKWPAKASPWLGLGALQQSRKLWEESRLSFEKALSLDSRLEAAWLALADSLIELGRLREAAAAREKFFTLSKARDSELKFRQAGLWYALGEFEKSEKALLESEAGATAEAFYLQGCLEFRKGNLENAERQFSAALEIRQDYPEAVLNLGIVHYNQGNEDLAARTFESLLRKHPRHKAARDYLGASRAMLYDRRMRRGSRAVIENDPARAAREWELALPFAPEPAQLKRMIKSLRATLGARPAGEKADDARLSATILADQKASIATHEEMAEILQAQGKSKDAMGEFEAALTLDPQNPRLRAKLRQLSTQLRRAIGGLLAQAGEWEAAKKNREALASAEAALALDPDDLEAGRMAKRLAAGLELKREDPALANSLYYEGAYRYGAGDTHKALEIWRRGLQAFPRNFQIKQAIVAAETKLKSLAEFERRK